MNNNDILAAARLANEDDDFGKLVSARRLSPIEIDSEPIKKLFRELFELIERDAFLRSLVRKQ